MNKSKLDEIFKLIDATKKRVEEIINAPDLEGTFEIKQTELNRTLVGSDIVVGIGYGLAPEGLEGKCLVLNNNFKWKLAYDVDGHVFLIPRIKNT